MGSGVYKWSICPRARKDFASRHEWPRRHPHFMQVFFALMAIAEIAVELVE